MPIINQTVKGGGTTPTGTIQITNNGTHDVTNYANADVQVPTTAPAHYIEKTVDANGKLVGGSNIISFSGVSSIGERCLYYTYYNNTNITGSVDMSSVQTIQSYGCNYAFYGCTGITSVDLSGLTGISQNGCNYMFYGCTGITGSIDMSSLGQANGMSFMFYGCTGITSIDLSQCYLVSGYQCFTNMFEGCTSLLSANLSSIKTLTAGSCCKNMFKGCTSLTTVDLKSLTNFGSNTSEIAYMFDGCSNLTTVDLSSLTSADTGYNLEYMFRGCTSLTTMIFYSLTSLKGSQSCNNMCNGCTSLTTLSFPCLTPSSFGSNTNQFNNMLSGVTGCTVHFPSNIQSTIGSWAPVTGGFGGTNTTVLFDLPTTVTLTGADSVTYTRNPKYDTATALAWKVGAYGTTNFDPAYYTSGTTDPVVSDTIYSDAACTTTVTTISSIA